MRFLGSDGIRIEPRQMSARTTASNPPGYDGTRFPNYVHVYCVQASTLFANGPVFIEFQADFIHNLFGKKESGDPITKAPPGSSTGLEGRDTRNWGHDAIPKGKVVVMGANVPNIYVEMLHYFAGIPLSLIVQRVISIGPLFFSLEAASASLLEPRNRETASKA
ncbi:hypothetical protein N7522_006818 [Penicillium canescens]|uniref:Uncharacterized protein n=1 Tax=Penicillium canescens TaxID=5083 RepID=A0AAD6N6E2_PENCN|nr:hypothetical protein N7522_006818 [Penicillium canescens]KAJ6035350.1 hypothetical protein N7460_009525 [Penicillium canescens]KAJ6166121.1 hypothetical protein N7485_009365 [Penicillium canescens]